MLLHFAVTGSMTTTPVVTESTSDSPAVTGASVVPEQTGQQTCHGQIPRRKGTPMQRWLPNEKKNANERVTWGGVRGTFHEALLVANVALIALHILRQCLK